MRAILTRLTTYGPKEEPNLPLGLDLTEEWIDSNSTQYSMLQEYSSLNRNIAGIYSATFETHQKHNIWYHDGLLMMMEIVYLHVKPYFDMGQSSNFGLRPDIFM